MDINLLKNQWEYVLRIDPFATYEDIENIVEIDDWDLLVVFKDGRKIIYDRFNGYHKNIIHDNINELTEDQERKEFAYRLRSLMGRNKITQEMLADEINISRTMISRYVRGESVPSAIVLRKIAKILNCSMDDFFYKQY